MVPIYPDKRRLTRSPFRSRGSVRISAQSIQVGFGLLLVSGLAQAQTQQPAALAPAMNGSATLSHFDSATNTQCDYVIGRNLKGPYMLSWKGIRPGSEEVVCDGLILKRDTDYTIDVKTGQIAFTSPIGPKTIIRVSYRCDTIDSTPNNAPFVLPLQYNLWQSGKSSLSFRTLFRPEDGTLNSNKDSSSLLSALQFVGATRMGKSSELDSGIFMDLRGGDWLGRSGIRLLDKTKLGFGDFSLGYTRAGAQFNQDNSGLKPGLEIREATGSLTPLTGLKIGTTLRQTTTLPDTSTTPDAKGTTTQETGGSLSLALPKNTGKVEASRTLTDVTTPDTDGLKKTQDTVTVEHVLAPNTRATVGYDALTQIPTSPTGQENKDQGTYTQTTRVEVTSRPVPQLSLTGSFRNELSSIGPADTQGLKLEATPFNNLKTLKLTATWEDRFQQDGASRRREARIELPMILPMKAQISGGFQETTAPGKERTVGLVDAKAKPMRYVEIGGLVRVRDGFVDTSQPDPDAVNSYTLNLSVTPWKELKLTGSLIRNPESSDGTIRKSQAQTVGMESKLGMISVRGQYGFEDQYLTLSQARSLELGLDLRLTRWDTLSTGFEGHSLLGTDPSDTLIYKLGYTRRMGSAFDFSVNGTLTQNRSLAGADSNKPELKAEAKVGLHF